MSHAAARCSWNNPKGPDKTATCACPHAHLRDVAACASTSEGRYVPTAYGFHTAAWGGGTFGIARAQGRMACLGAQHALHKTRMRAEHGSAKRRANLPLSLLRNIRTHVTRAHVRALSHLECTHTTKRMIAFVSPGTIGTWTLQGPGRPRPRIRGSGRESVPAGAGLQTRVCAGTAGPEGQVGESGRGVGW